MVSASETAIWLRSAGVRFSCPSSRSGTAFRRVKTADVTPQRGQSGSSSPRAPDRPAEPHDGWALSISWLHLWPVPDYSWRLLYSPLSSALNAPLTPHSQRKLLELSHHSTEGKTTVGHERGEWKNEVERRISFISQAPPLSYLQCSNDIVKRWESVPLACYFQVCAITITLTFNTFFVKGSNKALESWIYNVNVNGAGRHGRWM